MLKKHGRVQTDLTSNKMEENAGERWAEEQGDDRWSNHWQEQNTSKSWQKSGGKECKGEQREEQTEIEQAMRGAKKGKSAQRRVKQSEEQPPPSLMFLCHGVVGFTDHFLPVLS